MDGQLDSSCLRDSLIVQIDGTWVEDERRRRVNRCGGENKESSWLVINS